MSEETVGTTTESTEIEIIDGGGAPSVVMPCEHGDGEVIGLGFGEDNQNTYRAVRCPETGMTWAEDLR